ncbi:MAG: hypothetical protein WCI11_20815 [Candidatus Methylumidiphilus sp.]
MSNNDSKWVQLAKTDDNNSIDVDLKSIEKIDGGASLWARLTFNKIQRGPGITFNTLQQKLMLSCISMKVRVDASFFVQGKKKVSNNLADPTKDWVDPENGFQKYILEHVCK